MNKSQQVLLDSFTSSGKHSLQFLTVSNVAESTSQALPFELNLRKEKWIVISTYRSSLDSLSPFLESFTDIFSSAYDKLIIMVHFNVQPLDSAIKDFIKVNGLINLIKGQGSCIDLIFTNRMLSFKHSNSYETGISDYHHLIYFILKSSFSNS